MAEEKSKLKHMKNKQKQPSDVSDTSVDIRQLYYNDQASGFLLLVLMLAFLLVGTIFINIHIKLIEPTSKYILLDESNLIFDTYPLSEPIYSDSEVMDWAVQASVKLFDFNFLNLTSSITGIESLFTKKSFSEAIAIIKRDFIPKIFSERYIVQASVCDIPVIQQLDSEELANSKAYFWRISIPMVFKFAKDKYGVTEQQIGKVNLRIDRVSDLEYLGGLAISDINISDLFLVNRENYIERPFC